MVTIELYIDRWDVFTVGESAARSGSPAPPREPPRVVRVPDQLVTEYSQALHAFEAVQSKLRTLYEHAARNVQSRARGE
jgi:hypothetical protein